jgi:oligosaccharide repeat unit polymerase
MNLVLTLIWFLFVCTAILAGRVVLGGWFNHLVYYSTIWGASTLLLLFGLIEYHHIAVETWTYIFFAWFSLFLGTIVVQLFCRTKKSTINDQYSDGKQLARIIWVFALIGSLTLIFEVRHAVNEFGDILAAIMEHGNDLYLQRVGGETFELSYVGAFSYASCCLAGIYTARVGRVRLTAIAPFIVVLLNCVFSMERLPLIETGLLFGTSFLCTPRHFRFSKLQLRVGVTVALVIVLGGVFLVGQIRGLGVQYPGTSATMDKLSDYVPTAPSLYFYTTAPIAGFNEYLTRRNQEVGRFWGRYTFAPFYRVLARLGLPTEVPQVEEFYYVPEPININTYLKNVYSDFGPIGIIAFPLLLAVFLSFLHLTLENRWTTTKIVVLSHFQVVILFSIFYNLMLTGTWLLSLLVSVVVAARSDYVQADATSRFDVNSSLSLSQLR